MPPSLTLSATAKPDPSTDCLTNGCDEPPYVPKLVELLPYVVVPYIAAMSPESNS